VLAPDYELHADAKLKVRYAVPTGTDIDVYRKAIEDLPAQEGPDIFGLNPNADLTFRSLQVSSSARWTSWLTLMRLADSAAKTNTGRRPGSDVVRQISDSLQYMCRHANCSVGA